MSEWQAFWNHFDEEAAAGNMTELVGTFDRKGFVLLELDGIELEIPV